MKKYIFLLTLISLTCIAAEPKFHFRDCVKVVSGFYKGCSGFTIETLDTMGEYEVILWCKEYKFKEFFKEKDLKPANDCKDI